MLRSVTTTSHRDAVAKENYIYTHYEGWLPDDDDLPTNKWIDAWTANNLLNAPNDSQPFATPKFALPTSPATYTPPNLRHTRTIHSQSHRRAHHTKGQLLVCSICPVITASAEVIRGEEPGLRASRF